MIFNTMSNIVAKPLGVFFSFYFFFNLVYTFPFNSFLYASKRERPWLPVELRTIDTKKVPYETLGNIVYSKNKKRETNIILNLYLKLSFYSESFGGVCV